MVPPRRLLLALLLLALAAPPAMAAYPGRNGAVAYVADVDGVSTLLVRSGSRVRAVLDGDTISSPAWSPQGRRIALVRTGPDGQDVWVAGHDGQGARPLTASGGDATDPTWSPGGNEIAFAKGPAGARHVYAVRADGSGLRQITSGTADERQPAWSAAGPIAYVVRTTNTGDDLYVVAAGGGKPRRLTRMAGNEHSPSWSPDGRRLVFVRAGQLWTIGADGKRLRRVTEEPGPYSGPAWSPSGKRIVFAAGRPGSRVIATIGPGGRGRKVLSATADGRDPDWQPTGFDPVIAAAGDIACDPESRYFNGGVGVPARCGQLRTSNLLLGQDLWKILPLGDVQYERGELPDFMASYDPTWGRTKYLQRPVIGNHEYASGAGGYFDYFNGAGVADGPAGDRTTGGYYSYDIGRWHVVALNSECSFVPGGCAAGSPQQQWLAADLAANPRRCTMAVWHTPRFSSFNGGALRMAALWDTFAAAGGDVVLTAHHHFYERMAPIDGVREFIVGTGGRSIRDSEGGNHPSSQRRIETTLGVLRLVLRADGYDWRFLSASADPATDAGSDICR